MLTLLAPTPTNNDKQGNGKYRPLRRRKKQKKAVAENPAEFSYLRGSKDITMKFSTARDPIYVAFDCLENRSLSQLMSDFVQDSFFEITNFVSKVVK